MDARATERHSAVRRARLVRLFGTIEEDAVAARADVHLAGLLDLDVELRRQVHVAAEADAATHLDDRDAATPLEDLLVALAQRDAEPCRDGIALGTVAVDLATELVDATARALVVLREALLERGELALRLAQTAVHGLGLLEQRQDLFLEARVRFLRDLDLALRDDELLVVADAAQTHPPLLVLALGVLQLRLELAAAAVRGTGLGARALHLLALLRERGLELGGLTLELRELELALAVPPIDFL